MKLYLHPGVGLPVVGSEPAPAVPLAVPEVEVRVAPRRLRRLHLERVVVMTLDAKFMSVKSELKSL